MIGGGRRYLESLWQAPGEIHSETPQAASKPSTEENEVSKIKNGCQQDGSAGAAIKTDGLNSVPRSHVMEEENQPNNLPRDLHPDAMAHACPLPSLSNILMQNKVKILTWHQVTIQSKLSVGRRVWLDLPRYKFCRAINSPL